MPKATNPVPVVAAEEALGPPLPGFVRSRRDDVLDVDLVEVVDPVTGLPTPLSGGVLELGVVLLHAREVKAQLDEVIRVVGDEVLRRMDARGEWTLTPAHLKAPGGQTRAFKLSGASPAAASGRIERDAEGLYWTLDRLVAEGVLDAAARDNAVKREEVFKAVEAGIKRLEKIGGAAAQAVADHTTIHPPTETRRAAPSVKLG
jgi:hypothetical protein